MHPMNRIAAVLIMLALCASAWASDTFIWKGPSGEVDVTVIVGNSSYFYVVKNVSFPTVQELMFVFPAGASFSTNPVTYPSGWNSSYESYFSFAWPDAPLKMTMAYTEKDFTCFMWYLGECEAYTDRFTMTGGGIPPGSQAVFQGRAPDTSPQNAAAGSYAIHMSNASYCDFNSIDYTGTVPSQDPDNPQCLNPTPFATGGLIGPVRIGSREYSKDQGEVFGTIGSTAGTVTLNGNPAVVGTVMTLGNTLATGPDGSAVIASPDGSVVSLSSSSIVQLYGKVSATRFMKILAGRLWAKITPNPDRCSDDSDILEPCDALDVSAPNAVVGVRGTDVVIETNGATTTVTVNEGIVDVANLTGDTLNSITSVPAGSTLSVGPPISLVAALAPSAPPVIDANGDYVVNLQITNMGTTTASAVNVDSATLVDVNGGKVVSIPAMTSLPAALSDIAPDSSVSLPLTFPSSAGAPGTEAALRWSVGYSSGTASGTIKLKLP